MFAPLITSSLRMRTGRNWEDTASGGREVKPITGMVRAGNRLRTISYEVQARISMHSGRQREVSL